MFATPDQEQRHEWYEEKNEIGRKRIKDIACDIQERVNDRNNDAYQR